MITCTGLAIPTRYKSQRYRPAAGCGGCHLRPGKKQEGALFGSWHRDLTIDLEAVAAWNAAAVVTLVEPHELEALAIVDIGQEVRKRHMECPPATVCVWSYEAMYDDAVKTNGRYDNWKRLEALERYFAAVENDKRLIFHYENYSNPLSQEGAKRYVVVGLSRVKRLGDIIYYPNTDAETKQKFGGAYVWQRNVETHYPDQGLRIPYPRRNRDLSQASEGGLRDWANATCRIVSGWAEQKAVREIMIFLHAHGVGTVRLVQRGCARPKLHLGCIGAQLQGA
jgi:hypothetical protein